MSNRCPEAVHPRGVAEEHYLLIESILITTRSCGRQRDIGNEHTIVKHAFACSIVGECHACSLKRKVM